MIVHLALALAVARQQPAARVPAPLPEVLVDRRLAESVPLRPGDTVRVRALAGSGAPRAFVVAGGVERAAGPHPLSRHEKGLRLHPPDPEAPGPQKDRGDRLALVL